MSTRTPMAVTITVLSLVILSWTGIAQAQTNTQQWTTYYPVPDGRYQRLTVDGTLYTGGTLTVNGSTSLGTTTVRNLNVTGNFGIGTTNPTQRLDVNGDIALSGVRALSLSSDQSGLILGNGSKEGNSNTFIGIDAGIYVQHTQMEEGWQNVFVGNGAGLGATTALNNVAVGRNALMSLTGYVGNVAVGQSAGALIAGHSNVAIGNQALIRDTTGINNTVIGTNAAPNLTTGVHNIAIGYSALGSESAPSGIATGSYNIGLGQYTLPVCSACDSNIAIGGGDFVSYNPALGTLTNGSWNAAIGVGAGHNVDTGIYNVFVGANNFWSGASSITGDNNIVIGRAAGSYSGGSAGTRNGNIYIGYNAGSNASTPNNNIIIGYNVTAMPGSNDYLSIGTVLTGTNIYDAANGNIGIGVGTATPTAKLEVGGIGSGIKAVGYYYPSDKRLKENIVPVTGALAKVLALQDVYFNFKNDPKKRKTLGLIAQDIEPIVPEVVSTDSAGMKSVEYGNLVALLIEAIKEQQAEIEALRGELR